MSVKAGEKYNRLTVIRTLEGRKVLCRCECGNETIVFEDNLKRGHTRSCGCLKAEIIAAGAHTKHGGRHTRLYEIWRSMKQRCSNPNKINYERYGGRGISVCEEWKNSYQAFREWALSNGYRDDLSLDRIDNSGNYEPSNCRWETATAQSNNRRSNHTLTVNGETHTIAEWARITGINQGNILARVRLGWSPEKALEKQ